MAPRTKEETPDQPIDLSGLPLYVQNSVRSSQSYEVMSIERTASTLAAVSGRRYYGGDYPDKDFFLRIAETLPPAYRIAFVVPGEVTEEGVAEGAISYVLDLVDVRRIYNAFATEIGETDPDAAKALAEIDAVTKTYTKWFTDQGQAGTSAAQQYAAMDSGLSPLGATSSAVAEQTLALNPQATPQANEQPGLLPPAAPSSTADGEGVLPSETGFNVSEAVASMGGTLSGMDLTPLERTQINATIDDLRQKFGTLKLSWNGMVEKMFLPGKTGERSWNEAMFYPNSLTSDQIKKLQTALAQGGYFDRVRTPYTTFGTVDDATITAWNYLLADSIKTDSDPGSTLERQVANYQKTLAPQSGFKFMDPKLMREQGQQLAAQVLGRTMSDTELSSFIEYIRNWEIEASKPEVLGTKNYEIDLSQKAAQYFDDRYQAESLKWEMDQFLLNTLNPKALPKEFK